MAINPRTSPLKAFAKSPAKHQVHDGLDKVWHSNTQDGPHPNPNKKGEVITGPHNHKHLQGKIDKKGYSDTNIVKKQTAKKK